jgi:hypothetical protein
MTLALCAFAVSLRLGQPQAAALGLGSGVFRALGRPYLPGETLTSTTPWRGTSV